MKNKLIFLGFITFLFIFNAKVGISDDNSNVINEEYIYDDAHIIGDETYFNELIKNLNEYKNSGAKIILYTTTNEIRAKEKIRNGFNEYDLLNNQYNMLIVYVPGWSRPYLIFNKNCGLDKERILDFFIEDPLGLNRDFSNGEYENGFRTLTLYLINEIVFNIDLEKQACEAGTPLTDLSLFNGELKKELLKDSDVLAIPDIDLNRINKYNNYIEKAHNIYPVVPINLIKAIIEKESNGVYNRVNSNSGAAGLLQIMVCTGKDLGLVYKVKCAENMCRNGRKKCSPCSSECLKTIPMSASSDKRLNPELNIIKGTKYLNYLLTRCSNKQLFLNIVREKMKDLLIDGVKIVKGVAITKKMQPKDILRIIDEDIFLRKEIKDKDIIKCALASYNAGHNNVIKAVALTDSVDFNEYKRKMSAETRNYVPTVIAYYNWLESNYPEK